MDIVTINQTDHHVLREPAQTMTFPLPKEVRRFALELMQKMLDLGNAVGLAATQVDKPWRIFAFHISDLVKSRRKHVKEIMPATILINPTYTPLSEEKDVDWEGCFSIPEMMGEVPRYTKIRYEGYTIDGEKISRIAEGFVARVIQHEIGHLNGELYKDLILPNCHYGHADEMMKLREAEMKK
jgi:peptide deformylase